MDYTPETDLSDVFQNLLSQYFDKILGLNDLSHDEFDFLSSGSTAFANIRWSIKNGIRTKINQLMDRFVQSFINNFNSERKTLPLPVFVYKHSAANCSKNNLRLAELLYALILGYFLFLLLTNLLMSCVMKLKVITQVSIFKTSPTKIRPSSTNMPTLAESWLPSPLGQKFNHSWLLSP